jgi:NADH-quinone oxidoreductase subunit M
VAVPPRRLGRPHQGRRPCDARSELREIALLGPIAAAVLWMGVYPESFLKPMRADTARLVERLSRAAPAGDSKPTPGNPAAAPAHGEGHGTAAAPAHGGAH